MFVESQFLVVALVVAHWSVAGSLGISIVIFSRLKGTNPVFVHSDLIFEAFKAFMYAQL